jgi:hypothetical protein
MVGCIQYSSRSGDKTTEKGVVGGKMEGKWQEDVTT